MDEFFEVVKKKVIKYEQPNFVRKTDDGYQCFCKNCKNNLYKGREQNVKFNNYYSSMKQVYNHFNENELKNSITFCRKCDNSKSQLIYFLNIPNMRKEHFLKYHKQELDIVKKNKENVQKIPVQKDNINKNIYDLLD